MSVKQALAEYFDTMRAYAYEIVSIDSGIYDVDQPGELLRKPRRWFQMEADWINDLLEVLNIIQRYVALTNRWTKHAYGIGHNLQLTDDELLLVEQKHTSVLVLLASKTLEKTYLNWVLTDALQELDSLTGASRDLLRQVSRLVELIEQFGGSYLENAKRIAMGWTERNLNEFFEQLVTTLVKARTEGSSTEILQQIGTYLDIIFQMVTVTPMFVVESSTSTFSSAIIHQRQNFVDQLIKDTQNLSEFIQIRTTAYLRFLEHLEALLSAILPEGIAVTEWMDKFVSDSTVTAESLLPSQMDTTALPLALKQAREAHADWEALGVQLRPLRRRALNLGKLLQSPAITQFLEADQRRREVTRRWRPEMVSKFLLLSKATGSVNFQNPT